MNNNYVYFKTRVWLAIINYMYISKMTDQIYNMTVVLNMIKELFENSILSIINIAYAWLIYTHMCMVSYINYTRQPNF